MKRPIRVEAWVRRTEEWAWWGSYSTRDRAHEELRRHGYKGSRYRVLDAQRELIQYWGAES